MRTREEILQDWELDGKHVNSPYRREKLEELILEVLLDIRGSAPTTIKEEKE